MTRALATAALGVAICLAGATFDTPSLYVPGLVLAGLALGAFAWVRLAARGARVVRVPGPHSVVEEEPWPLGLELRHGLLPPPGGELWEPLLGRPLRLAGRSPGRVRVSVRFARRGRRQLEPPLLVVRDPLGLDEVRVPGAGGEELLVLPRIEPVEAVRAGGAAAGQLAGTGEHGGAGRQLAIAAAEQEIDGLRPYREGTAAARIHWPTVARRGEMLERRLVADLDSAPLVVLDSSRPASEEALDAAVRAAGSLCLHLARRGGAAILLPGERRPTDVGPELGAWPTVHARLALVEPGSTPLAVGRAPRGGAVLWVSAAALQRAPAALERLPAASRWLVTPAPLAGSAAVFTVAGCTGQRLDRVRRPGEEGGLSSLAAPVRRLAPSTDRAGAPLADPLALRLAAFAALAAFGAAQWELLVADLPGGRIAACVALATGGGALLGLLGRRRAEGGSLLGLLRLRWEGGSPLAPAGAAPGAGAGRPMGWRATQATAACVALATLLLGLVAAGLPARLLAPGHWGELADGLDRGLAGVQTVRWPYDGGDAWVRLSVLLGVPLLLSLAAALAFWPARRGGSALRGAGLVTLLVLYGTPVTEHDPGAPLLRGAALLALVAAWLWLPRLRRPDAGAAAAVVAGAGLLALPVAARLDADRAWWDYGSWDWFGAGKSVTFDWNHSYGPLDWPRDGTTLLYVRSDKARYWKAETLDAFDGFRWFHSSTNDQSGPYSELPDTLTPAGRSWEPYELNPRWDVRVRFTVRALTSQLIVGTGTTYSVRGIGPTSSTADGTTMALGEPLAEGDAYTVRAYAPDPSAAQMRRAPSGYAASMVQYTTLVVPRRGEEAPRRSGVTGDATQAGGRPLLMPLRGDPLSGSPDADRRLRGSPYARVYGLARRLTGSQPTAYEAVQAVQRHLARNFSYSERPPSRRLPLDAFLFQDRIGYCQQFSGAMALMLRMGGIPARVASGFAPGSYNRDTGEYRVRDLDAHSWVEVYFNGIGWVPFDPTPAAAPAQSQSAGLEAAGAARADAGELRAERSNGPASERAGEPRGGGGGGGPPWWAAALALMGAGAAASLGPALLRRRAALRRAPADAVDAQLHELESALRRLGWRVEAGSTLLALERRLARAAGPASARYAAALRAHRYARRPPPAPGLAERRAARRELTARRGPWARLRGLAAMPPGGPRRLA